MMSIRSEMTHFLEKIWNIWCRSYYCGWDFVKYYLKHQEVVYRAPKMPIILGKSRISADFGAVYVGPPIRIGAELGLCCQTEGKWLIFKKNLEYLASKLLRWVRFREILLKTPRSSLYSAKIADYFMKIANSGRFRRCLCKSANPNGGGTRFMLPNWVKMTHFREKSGIFGVGAATVAEISWNTT